MSLLHKLVQRHERVGQIGISEVGISEPIVRYRSYEQRRGLGSVVTTGSPGSSHRRRCSSVFGITYLGSGFTLGAASNPASVSHACEWPI